MVPLTPVTGPRLLIDPNHPNPESIKRQLLEELDILREKENASSAHILFPHACETAISPGKFLVRNDLQFQWQNKNYESFEHYLSSFRNSSRKAARKEREGCKKHPIEIGSKWGPDLDNDDWNRIYACYESTPEKKGGNTYLTPKFFSMLRETLAEKILITYATKGGKIIACAFNLQGGDALYGRYWGCLEEYEFLHFELCYYLPIELCIQYKWQHFSAGAQGIHKLKRGLLPTLTYSMHHIADATFHKIINSYLLQERKLLANQIEKLTEHSPFKSTED